MKEIQIDIPIYYDKIVVVYCCKGLKKAFKKYKLQGNHKLVDALVFRKNTKSGRTKYYALFRSLDKDVIAHETVHLVNHIFEDRYIELDTKNDEPQAYLTGWIFYNVYKALKNMKHER